MPSQNTKYNIVLSEWLEYPGNSSLFLTLLLVKHGVQEIAAEAGLTINDLITSLRKVKAN